MSGRTCSRAQFRKKWKTTNPNLSKDFTKIVRVLLTAVSIIWIKNNLFEKSTSFSKGQHYFKESNISKELNSSRK